MYLSEKKHFNFYVYPHNPYRNKYTDVFGQLRVNDCHK